MLANMTPQRTRAHASGKLPSTRCVALDGDSSCESEGVNMTRLMSLPRPAIKACFANYDCVKEISSDVPLCRANGEHCLVKRRNVRRAKAQVPSPKCVSFCDNEKERQYSKQFGACVPRFSLEDWVTSFRFPFTFDKLELF